MRTEDINSIGEFLVENYKGYRPNSVIIFSPDNSGAEVQLCKSFWGINPTLSHIGDWNLNDIKWNPHDLAIACNVFMASPDPQKWFDNLHSSGIKNLLLQDNIRAKRESNRELGFDSGDVMRYSVSSQNEYGVTDPGHETFDVSSMKYPVENASVYRAAPGDTGWIKFVAMIKLHLFLLFVSVQHEIQSEPTLMTIL